MIEGTRHQTGSKPLKQKSLETVQAVKVQVFSSGFKKAYIKVTKKKDAIGLQIHFVNGDFNHQDYNFKQGCQFSCIYTARLAQLTRFTRSHATCSFAHNENTFMTDTDKKRWHWRHMDRQESSGSLSRSSAPQWRKVTGRGTLSVALKLSHNSQYEVFKSS